MTTTDILGLGLQTNDLILAHAPDDAAALVPIVTAMTVSSYTAMLPYLYPAAFESEAV